MAQKRKKRNDANSPQARLLITLAVLLVAVTAGLLSRNRQQESAVAATQASLSGEETNSTGEMLPTEDTHSTEKPQTDGTIEVHFLDVGQGDSILIRCGQESMLIDAGTGENARDVTAYIKALGISSLKYVIATHPHEDHIGGMAECIRTFNIDTFIMPDIEHTTQTYEAMLDALIDRNVKVTKPLTGGQFNLGDASFTVLGPTSDYDGNLNNMSVGFKLTYGNTSFVMCGDAEEEAETAMCQNGIDLSADVLKLGHHGSSTSSCEAFLNAVSPSAAVISCGRDNTYGHPHQETLEKMEERQITMYRTDQQGTIIAVSDGSGITFTAAAVPIETVSETGNSFAPPDSESAAYYILNTNSHKFHLPDCSGVEKMKEKNKSIYEGDRKSLISQGYEPCGICNP